MRKPFVTAAERLEMQSLRDAGWIIKDICLAFDRSKPTVVKHTRPALKKSSAFDRNQYLIQVLDGRSTDDRRAIAGRFGLTNMHSLGVMLSQTRRAIREGRASV